MLVVDDKRINFSFSPSDLSKEHNLRKSCNEKSNAISTDHTYVAQVKEFTESDSFNDLDYSEIFDYWGEWSTKHIRRLIYVMDSFHISHEAYHELRLVSKGYLPPLGRLAKDKKIMSAEIPYDKHPTGCIQCVLSV